MKQNVEHLKNAKDNEEKEPQVSSTLINSGPRNEHNLLITQRNQLCIVVELILDVTMSTTCRRRYAKNCPNRSIFLLQLTVVDTSNIVQLIAMSAFAPSQKRQWVRSSMCIMFFSAGLVQNRCVALLQGFCSIRYCMIYFSLFRRQPVHTT